MINSHTIIINADIERIFQQALLWGEAEWWPKDCLMRYTRLDNSEILMNASLRVAFSDEAISKRQDCHALRARNDKVGSEGVVQSGTRYHQKVLLPFAPEWDVEIVSITPNRELKRRFLNGIFSGTDSVILEPVKDGIEVKAVMDFDVNGYFNKLAWRFVFEKMHDENVEKILRAMKEYFS